MSMLPDLKYVRDVRWGKDPFLDAWLHHFKTENNIEHLMNPEHVATDEQVRFMVALDEAQVYIPCSDDIFTMLLRRERPRALQMEYNRTWRFIVRLIRQHGFDKYNERRVIQFCKRRFRLHLASKIMIPSRLAKRLISIVLTQCAKPDPYRDSKRRANRLAGEFLRKPSTERLIYGNPPGCEGITDIKELRWELDFLELRRLLYLSTMSDLWQDADPSPLEVEKELRKPCGECSHLRLLLGPQGEERKKVLYLPDVSGAFVFDLEIIRALMRQGHQVILALKEGFYFNTPTLWELDSDPVLKSAAAGAHILSDDTVSKNELLRLLREHRFLVISDGTREQLNLYKTSVTFARAWKECDLIIAKGGRNYQNLIGCSHEFTRDIVCFYRSESGEFILNAKPRAKSVRKFAEADLHDKAKEIIDAMRDAKRHGKSVMFYSAIIGSIPGQTSTAIRVVDTFVRFLRERQENSFIINPAEYFEEGMDGDDLMFMWERVQRSGLLDIWRFQTVEDIETSFTLMGRKVPSVWSGKDSTFSTGCTKEMRIALDLQKAHPELQIIGPSSDKFFRRAEYGVGKYYDAGIKTP
ncbi:ARMT1-like domain-containing protein [Desulfovibrio psychrotolerans]|uniref:Damage-control phosphatase ARMT1-like metal-binding domain-containing protein n=1 Tax=Desulfovibrio psychrotolerans TaxID=415242 RepID=A0A7J0BU79_9BACT|nr:ARMT1-like domain-containing protein [Desulfovibrio psychrotolerans]GFM36695.1 hypothetical protein DSM19430T_13790 [Desulfovibrio psychrotolerans]